MTTEQLTEWPVTAQREVGTLPLARLFQRSTGLPPHRYVVRARIDHAAELLAAPEPSIARISRMVGFRTASHFSTVFRRITGVTPHEYRGRCLHAAAAPRAEGMDGSR